jgi:hypothetical protein
MKKEIQERIALHEQLNDVHQYKLILEAADLYIDGRKTGEISDAEIELGREVVVKMVEVSFIASLPQYEHDYSLQREMLIKKIRAFKWAIPDSHTEIRGLTEMLVGHKENELG